jgi:hypothetical protein
MSTGPPTLFKQILDDTIVYTIVDSVRERKLATENLGSNAAANAIWAMALMNIIRGKITPFIPDPSLALYVEEYVARFLSLVLARNYIFGDKDSLQEIAKDSVFYYGALIVRREAGGSILPQVRNSGTVDPTPAVVPPARR